MEIIPANHWFSMLLLSGSAYVGSFNISVILGLLILFILLGFMALLSAAEIAFFSLKASQLKEIRINTDDKDDLVAQLLQQPKKLLATLLIIVNLVNVAIVILSTYISNQLFDFSRFPVFGFLIQIIIVTALILFFGEVLPKVFATQNSTKVAVRTARTIKFLVWLVEPFSKILVNSTNFVDRRLSMKSRNLTMSELEEAIEITTDENTPEDEKKILRGIVNFTEIEVSEIMKPRIFITAVDNQLNYHDLLSKVLEAGYSRVPVYEENLDTVIGILYIKELLPYMKEDKDFNWIGLLRPAFFVPENKKINDLLEEFQEKKMHLAIVVDEYGGTSGIVTMEDIIEEIVGEIRDEFDLETEQLPYTKLDDHNFIFPGEVPINDFCRMMGVEPEVFEKIKGESGTLAGLILEITGKIPEQNEKINSGRFVFRIESVDERRIEKVKITLSDASEEL